MLELMSRGLKQTKPTAKAILLILIILYLSMHSPNEAIYLTIPLTILMGAGMSIHPWLQWRKSLGHVNEDIEYMKNPDFRYLTECSDPSYFDFDLDRLRADLQYNRGIASNFVGFYGAWIWISFALPFVAGLCFLI